MKNNSISSITLCFLLGLAGAAQAECEQLSGQALEINGHGFKVNTEPMVLIEKQDETHLFKTILMMDNQPSEPIVAICKNRHLVFTRIDEGYFIQVYQGWLERQDDGSLRVAGTYSQYGGTWKWGWYGRARDVQQ